MTLAEALKIALTAYDEDNGEREAILAALVPVLLGDRTLLHEAIVRAWRPRYQVTYTADSEGNWCSQCSGRGVSYATRAQALAAIEADPTSKPDCYGNTCSPEVIEITSVRDDVADAIAVYQEQRAEIDAEIAADEGS